MNKTDRRGQQSAKEACVVCGTTDARTLSSTRLALGERVTVCGSHKTAHHRSGVIAASVEELKSVTGDRRANGFRF